MIDATDDATILADGCSWLGQQDRSLVLLNKLIICPVFKLAT